MLIGRFKYSDRIIKGIGDKYVVLHNINNAQSVRITKELFNIIDNMCTKKIEVENILHMCETEEDKMYFCEKCESLLDKSILRKEADNSEYEKLDLEIDLDITNKCNLKCKHCCVDANIQSLDLDKEAMFQIIDKIVETNPSAINISGGEPLVRKDFVEIICHLKEKYKGKLFLMTNAILIDFEMAKFIVQNFNGVSVSLDGVDEKTCAAVRGEGTFEKTMKGIENLNKAGVEFLSASMVLTKLTANKRKEFKEICEKINAMPMCRVLSLDGRASKEMLELIPTDEEVVAGRLDEHDNPMPFSCTAASKRYQIDYQGNLFPCQSLMFEDYKLGNVLEIESLFDFIRKREVIKTKGYTRLEKLFPENLKSCKGCKNHIFCFTCLRGIHYNMAEIEKCCRDCVSFEKYFE